MVYTSSALSLAALELLVHTDPDLVPDDLQVSEIDVPGSLAAGVLDLATLPPDWRAVPNHPACRAVGDDWVRRRDQVLLGVPSAIVPEELNYLINPAHPEAARIQIVRVRAFAFDKRLL